jgi:hypothetical protein
VPDTSDLSTNQFNLRIDATKALPGEYIVVLKIDNEDDKQTVEVPVKVTEREKREQAPE